MFSDFMFGARSRLLPASVPFRFFATAVALHAVAWAVLVWAGEAVPGYIGGGGPALAALHLVTLGVLAMVAMGAAYQLLPVATRRPVRSVFACKVSHALLAPSLLLLVYGFVGLEAWAMHGGAMGVILGIGLFGVLIADNLRRVDDMPLVTGHAWAAVLSLAVLLLLGLLLVADFTIGFLPDHTAVATAHAVAGGYGFMGMLAVGFSYVLMPMFALSQLPAKPYGGWALKLSVAALILGLAGALSGMTALLGVAAVFGLAAAGLYVELMRLMLKTRMRRQLGLSFMLVRVAWGMLPLSLLAGLAVAAGWHAEVTAPLFGFLLIYGWLLTFVMGVLQRIMPFLASMHSYRPGGKPALVSMLTAEQPLTVHAWCHLAALALVSAGIISGAGWLVRLGALAGLAGAVAFIVFAVLLWRRLRQHLREIEAIPTPSASE